MSAVLINVLEFKSCRS